MCNFIHFSDKYLLLFVIVRAKIRIRKIAEFQFYFSAKVRVARPTPKKIQAENADDHVVLFS